MAHEHYFLLAMVAIHINLAYFPQILLMHTTGLVEIVNITLHCRSQCCSSADAIAQGARGVCALESSSYVTFFVWDLYMHVASMINQHSMYDKGILALRVLYVKPGNKIKC